MCKFDVDYSQRDIILYHDAVIKEVSINKEIKLSIHNSGFVQFSGKGILSGIDKHTGQIKGMGLWSSPLVKPICGPTFGFTFWGLPGFEQCMKEKNSNKNTIIFDKTDFYYRHCNRLNWNGYIIEGFFLRQELSKGIKYVNRIPTITLQLPNYEIPRAVFTLKVIFLEDSPGFIGLLASKTKLNFPKEFTTGYTIGGPSGNIRIINGKRIGTWMFCQFPKPSKFNPPSLHYN